MNDFVEIFRKTVEIKRIKVEINLHFVEIMFSRGSIYGASLNLPTLYGNAVTFSEESSALHSNHMLLQLTLVFNTSLKTRLC